MRKRWQSEQSRGAFLRQVERLLALSREGKALWQREDVPVLPLPVHAETGFPARGINALLLWEATPDFKLPGAWERIEDGSETEDTPRVQVPLRGGLGWVPVRWTVRTTAMQEPPMLWWRLSSGERRLLERRERPLMRALGLPDDYNTAQTLRRLTAKLLVGAPTWGPGPRPMSVLQALHLMQLANAAQQLADTLALYRLTPRLRWDRRRWDTAVRSQPNLRVQRHPLRLEPPNRLTRAAILCRGVGEIPTGELSEDWRRVGGALAAILRRGDASILEVLEGTSGRARSAWRSLVRGVQGRGDHDVDPAVRLEEVVMGIAPPSDAAWSELLASLPSPRYRREARRKPDGGVRRIDVPLGELPDVQRRVGRLLTTLLPGASPATAFRPGMGPRDHAMAHAGCRAAVVVDIADFFGSVRPRHLEPWLLRWAMRRRSDPLAGWSAAGRQALLDLAFTADPGGWPYLPQGAPSSPPAANLAATWMDLRLLSLLRAAPFAGLRYTRYADDLVVSLSGEGEVEPFLAWADEALTQAVESQGWRVNPLKRRGWTHKDGPLVLCGVVVPDKQGGEPRLPRDMARRARAAMWRLRRGDATPEDARQARGTCAHAFAVTRHPGWLAYASRSVARLAEHLAGPALAPSFLAGWADSVESHADPE